MTDPPYWEVLAQTQNILAGRGFLEPFARVRDSRGGWRSLEASGTTRTRMLEDLYVRLGALAPEEAREALVVSQGSSDAHPSLLVLYHEVRDGAARRGIGVVTVQRRPAFLGPVRLWSGRAAVGALDWQEMQPRLWADG